MNDRWSKLSLLPLEVMFLQLSYQVGNYNFRLIILPPPLHYYILGRLGQSKKIDPLMLTPIYEDRSDRRINCMNHCKH